MTSRARIKRAGAGAAGEKPSRRSPVDCWDAEVADRLTDMERAEVGAICDSFRFLEDVETLAASTRQALRDRAAGAADAAARELETAARFAEALWVACAELSPAAHQTLEQAYDEMRQSESDVVHGAQEPGPLTPALGFHMRALARAAQLARPNKRGRRKAYVEHGAAFQVCLLFNAYALPVTRYQSGGTSAVSPAERVLQIVLGVPTTKRVGDLLKMPQRAVFPEE